MIHMTKLITIISALCFFLAGCTKFPTTVSDPTPSSSEVQIREPTITPEAVPVDKVTPTIDPSNIIITPEAVLPNSTLEVVGTFVSTNLCKQVPKPSIILGGNVSSPLAGRFALCVLREGISAIDLDSGDLVDSNSPNADIQLRHSQTTLDNKVFYYIKAINNAFVDEVDTNNITYTFCENTLRALNRPGIYIIQQGTVACVLTTQGQVALIRTESIDMFGIESVEFSFAILKR